MNPEVLAALANGDRVVTSTRRLRHELIKAYDLAQLKNGKDVWETPLVSTWEGWIQALWNKHNLYSSQVVLSTHQLRHLLGRIIELDLEANKPTEGANLEALWNIGATAKTALAAWQLCHQWQIPFSPLKEAPNEDHARFGRWANNLYAQLQHSSWISPQQLTEQLIRKDIQPQEPILLVGFDHFDRQQRSFIDFLESKRVTITQLCANAPERTRLRRFSFESPDAEWRQIGAWARQYLEKNPNIRLAVVTPDLESIQSLATRTLREQLTPDYFLHNTPDLFHFSLGQALSAIPVVRSALGCLQLLDRLEYPQLESVFQSNDWGDPAVQQFRAKLAIELRRQLAFEFDLFDLLRAIEQHSPNDRLSNTPDGRLLKKLESLQAIRHANRQRLNIASWRDIFTRCLNLLEWPAELPDSAEFQALQAWDKCLEDWVRLDLVGQPLTIRQAITSLTGHCHETQFQPQPQADAPVQVMGFLETAGLEFDAVWLADFDESAWPGIRHLNPFIPIATQIEHGIPEATPTLQHDLSSRRTQQLCQLAEEVNFSHARMMDDIERDISQMFPHLAASTTDELPAVFNLNKAICEATPALEAISDDNGLPYTMTEAGGGTSLIQKQSACPFSAYAYHRLNAAEDDRPGPGMDSMQRGSLLHRTLENIWNEIGDSSALHKHAEQGSLPELVRHHATEQIKYYARNAGLGEGYQGAELDRLTALISEWLDLEQSRLPFRVVANEHQVEFAVAGLLLNVKIDRIDEITLPGKRQPTSRMIMDYKSGKCSIRDWANERPAQPQVPLYFLAMENTGPTVTDALAFAQVRRHEPAFIGITRFDDVIPGVDSLESLPGNNTLKRSYHDWNELVAGWQHRIKQLAKEFKQGVATVDPQPGACNWCQFHSLCRIHTRGQQEEENAAD